jgi:hypothetical protein
MAGCPVCDPGGFSYEPNNPDVINTTVQYIRTHNFNETENHTVVINSYGELRDYYNKNNHGTWPDYNFDGNYAFDCRYGEKSFAEAIERYDGNFFENNILVFAVITEGSGSVSHNVTGVGIGQRKDRYINTIYIDRLMPEMGTCDMAYWHIIIEISRADIVIDAFGLELNDVRLYYNCGFGGFVPIRCLVYNCPVCD